MAGDNPMRRAWQRETPLSSEQEVAPHSRKVKRPKRWGLRVTYGSFMGRDWEWTTWYERERDRDNAAIAKAVNRDFAKKIEKVSR